MSLESLTSKILVEFKGDVSDLKRGLKELQGEERKLQEAAIAGAEAKNRALEGTIKTIGRVGVAFGTVTAAAKFAFEAIEKYGQHLDLVGSAGSISIDGLSKAAKGLKTNMELLQHAAKLNTGAFKLSQSQMETVEKAMYVLEERGKSSGEVWNAVSDALTKGTTRSLEGLGIIVDKTGLSLDENGVKMDTYGQKAKAVERIMSALAGTAKEAEGAQLDAADKVQAATTRMKNYFDEAILKIGELAAQLAPIIDMLADAAGLAGKLLSKIPGGAGAVAGAAKYGIPVYGQALMMRDAADSLYNGSNLFEVMKAGKAGMDLNRVIAINAASAARGQIWNDQISMNADASSGFFGTKGGSDAIAKGLAFLGDAVGRAASDPWGRLGKGKSGPYGGSARSLLGGVTGVESVNSPWGTSDALSGPSDVYGDEFGRDLMDSIDLSKYGRTQSAADEYNAYNAGKSQSKLAQMFGPIEDFDLYAKGFEMLSGAVGSAMSAWIDGSQSAGAAFKKFVGEAVKSISIQMAMEALKHGAYAIGSLAFGDVRGAAMHGKAAALHAAGSVAAAIAAKQLVGGSGGAQQGQGGGGYAAAPASTQPGASAGGASTIIVAYGQDYSQDSARQKQLRAAKVFEDAKASGAFPGVRNA